MRRITIMLVIALFSFMGCGSDDERDETTAQDVKEEADDVIETAERYTAQEKEQYEQEIEEQIAKAESTLSELRQKAAEVKGTTQDELNQQISELEEDVQDLKDKYQQLRMASGEAWTDIKSGIDSAAFAIQEALDEARSEFADK